MKFSHTLDEQRELSPIEWGPFFLNYKLLKKKIKRMTDVRLRADNHHISPTATPNSQTVTTPEALARSRSEVEFFRMLDYEASRSARFLALSKAQYVLKTRNVLDGYQSTQHLLRSQTLGLGGMISCEAATDMWIRLMDTCISVYTELLLLNHWVIVSYCGFSKILKKHDRWTGFMTKDKYLRFVVARQHLSSYSKLHAMLRDMESLYLHVLRELPQCPERANVERKMKGVKDAGASAALEFAPHTEELTQCIRANKKEHHCITDSKPGRSKKKGTGTGEGNLCGPSPTAPTRSTPSSRPAAAGRGGGGSSGSCGVVDDPEAKITSDGGAHQPHERPERKALSPAAAAAAAAAAVAVADPFPRVSVRVAGTTGLPSDKRKRIWIEQESCAEVEQRSKVGKFHVTNAADAAGPAVAASLLRSPSSPVRRRSVSDHAASVDRALRTNGAAGVPRRLSAGFSSAPMSGGLPAHVKVRIYGPRTPTAAGVRGGRAGGRGGDGETSTLSPPLLSS